MAKKNNIIEEYQKPVPDDFFEGRIVGQTEEGYLIQVPIISEIKKHNIKEVRVQLKYSELLEDDQRKKAWVLLQDIMNGEDKFFKFKKEVHNRMKKDFCTQNGLPYFSLSNSSKELAARYINFLINYIIENNIESESVMNDDFDESTGKMMYAKFMQGKCMICEEEYTGLIRTQFGRLESDLTIDDLNEGDEVYFLCDKHKNYLLEKGEKFFNQIYYLHPLKITTKTIDKKKEQLL